MNITGQRQSANVVQAPGNVQQKKTGPSVQEQGLLDMIMKALGQQ